MIKRISRKGTKPIFLIWQECSKKYQQEKQMNDGGIWDNCHVQQGENAPEN